MDEVGLKKNMPDINRAVLIKGFPLTMSARGLSMFPLIQSRDKVVTVACDEGSLSCGDIILYEKSDADSTMIAHRLVKKKRIGQETFFITKGDTSFVCDAPVPSRLMVGKIIRINKGRLNISLDGMTGRILNLGMLLISLSRVLPLGIAFLRKAKVLIRKNDRKK